MAVEAPAPTHDAGRTAHLPRPRPEQIEMPDRPHTCTEAWWLQFPRDLAVEWSARPQEPGPGAGSGSVSYQPGPAALAIALARQDAGQDVVAVRVVGSM